MFLNPVLNPFLPANKAQQAGRGVPFDVIHLE